jgi:hypothetical protein
MYRAFTANRKDHQKGRRDEFNGDAVGISFDSYHDHRTGFDSTSLRAGQKIDLVLTNPMHADMSWNAVWYQEQAWRFCLDR